MPVRERKFYIKKHNEYQSELNNQKRQETPRSDLRRRQQADEENTKTALRQIMG